ncbi:MAG: class I SAM-dependent methyltransferase [Spirulinaceae cyanobacterium RM2_2_10]|nr:class I SAM-dependent methyltransferase [Spirulinaceae cyanobacterium SM2_1_0]NJO19694.1 class I SAM-dependent methyltransferase [Spirulinaceae cyanobacterium RM2_2_10]
MQSSFAPAHHFPLPDGFGRNLYYGFQQAKALLSVAHKTVSDRLTEWVAQPDKSIETLSPETLLELQRRNLALLERDWEEAQQGVYPQSLLFDWDAENVLRHYPQVWLDLPAIWDRVQRRQYQEFATPIERADYPKYYLQNFHHQTDGYLSDRSAELYDLQVELLFNGSANAMRRRILAPLKQGLQQAFATTPPSQQRVLDIACGTGYTLQGLRAALPKVSLYGIDLSTAYLRKANQILAKIPGELPQLAQANAENLPYQDHYFHGTTSVFLFHELPATARQNVINEAYRVTQPGGTFVICDSMQLPDTPEFAPMMKNFTAIFHEPYYRHYICDDLVARLETAGFVVVEVYNHFVSKYWVARKPT